MKPGGPLLSVENLRTEFHTDEGIVTAVDGVSWSVRRGETVPPAPRSALPVITFDDSLSIHFNGEEIEVMHAPAGHTDTDSIIYFHGSNVLHMGDHFFAGRFPFVDIASGGSVAGYEKNVRYVLEHAPDDVKIIPGHGPLSTKADLTLFHEMLSESIAAVQKGIDAGNTVEEIQEAGLSSKWDGWGSGFINSGVWLQTVHQSLSQ